MGRFDIFRRRNKNDGTHKGAFIAVADHPTVSFSVVSILAKKLRKITNNFGDQALIGIGTCGRVFHGVLENGQAVAIKKLGTSKQREQEFLARVTTASGLNDENVIRLVGYCTENELRAVAYEYAPQGSLYDILHRSSAGSGGSSAQVLSWNARMKIAVGAAKGLEYLHEKCDPHIVLLNLKSTNVLIFDEFATKIDASDIFSEVPLGCMDRTPGVFGIFVYDAPELALPGVPAVKSDIYSFGVIMLEILTGCTPFGRTIPDNQGNIVRWAKPKLTEDKLHECIDSKLQGAYPPKAAAKFASIAAMCLEHDEYVRPRISTVVLALRPLLEESTGSVPYQP